jgi:hypothetical protein
MRGDRPKTPSILRSGKQMRLEYERNLLRLQREEIGLRATLRWCLAVGAATVALHNLAVTGTGPHRQLLHPGSVQAVPDTAHDQVRPSMRGGKEGAARSLPQLVRQRRHLADRRLQRLRQSQQRRVAGVADAALNAADLRQVGVGRVGQFFLAHARFEAEGADGLAEGGVFGRAGFAAAGGRHCVVSSLSTYKPEC